MLGSISLPRVMQVLFLVLIHIYRYTDIYTYTCNNMHIPHAMKVNPSKHSCLSKETTKSPTFQPTPPTTSPLFIPPPQPFPSNLQELTTQISPPKIPLAFVNTAPFSLSLRNVASIIDCGIDSVSVNGGTKGGT